jgi:hypoxanthine phosphoribosyltransferase
MKTELLFNKEIISNRIANISFRINKDYHLQELIIICVLKGAIHFTSDLMRKIDSVDCSLDFIRISSYGGETSSSGKINLIKDLENDIKGKNVLIVDDILDTGLSLNYLVKHLKERDPKDIKTCVLLDKPDRRKYNIKADYVGFEIDNEFVIGYGLDYKEKLRELPDIYIVKEL